MRLWRKKQPTTPIWIKCRKTGLYELIPYDKMIQFPSGKWGFTAQCFDLATAKFLQNHLDHFQYQHQTNTWVFEPVREDCRPWALRGVSIMGSAALGVNAMMFFVNLWQHEYSWAIPPVVCIGMVLFVMITSRKYTHHPR